jgi:hypothetical protein
MQATESRLKMVESPAHYQNFSQETWVMMLKIWGADKFAVYCEINAFKYKMRAGTKDGSSAIEDLQKAEWYLKKAKEYGSGNSI